MFYLKYRPKKFAEVVGSDNIIQTLQKVLGQSSLPHAFLFTGPRGSGKTTVARLLAKALNCEDPIVGEYGIEVCAACSNCLAITEGRFLDLIEIDAASNRGIDDIRSLRERVKLSPSLGKYKVYIIDEVHMLTIEAFNALLKTLEEPPAHTIFVLATTEAQKIPETIKSRCHVFNFKRANRENLLAKMDYILTCEGVKLEKEKLEEVVRHAEGGFRDAETLLEQLVAGFSDLGGADSRPDLLVEFIGKRDKSAALNFIGELYKKGTSLGSFNQNLLFYLRDLLLVKSGSTAKDLSLEESVFNKVKDLSEFFTAEEIYKMVNSFIKAGADFKLVSIPQLPSELAIVRIFEELGDGKTIKDDNSDKTNPSEDLGIKGFGRPEKDEGKEEKKESGGSAIDPSTNLSLEEVKDKWSEVLSQVKPENHSLEALLRSARPKEIDSNNLVIEVFYKFHKDKLSSVQSLDILGRVLEKVFRLPLRASYILTDDKSVKAREVVGEAVSDDDIKAAALKAFSGD